MSDPKRPFDAVLIQGGCDRDEVFDQEAITETPLETEPEPAAYNIYEVTSQMTRKILWGQKQRAAVDQAAAYLSYGDTDSALETIKGFEGFFTHKYGAFEYGDVL